MEEDAKTKRQTVVKCVCNRCGREHWEVPLPGMKLDQHGVTYWICDSCRRILLFLIPRGRRDLRGQMFLPGLLDDE